MKLVVNYKKNALIHIKAFKSYNNVLNYSVAVAPNCITNPNEC
jgi:hypothetical protein